MSGGGRFRRVTALGAMFLAAYVFIACSGSAATSAPFDESNGGGVFAGPVEAPATAAPVAIPGSTPAAGSDGSTADAGTYIVRTGTLDVEVTDVDAAATQARALVTSIGGYVSASDESTKGDQHTATITYRIPVDKWQDTITALRAIGTRVISENTQADEVTSQVVDLNARIDNARASEASLRDIMSRAGTIDDVLNVQSRLDSVQQSIEEMVAQQQDLTGRAALGTLAVSWETPVVAAVQEVQSGWNLGTEVDHALAQTVTAGQTLASFLIWLLLVGVPVFGPILLVALVAIWLMRRYQRRHPRQVYAAWQPVPSAPAAEAGTGRTEEEHRQPPDVG